VFVCVCVHACVHACGCADGSYCEHGREIFDEEFDNELKSTSGPRKKVGCVLVCVDSPQAIVVVNPPYFFLGFTFYSLASHLA